MSSFCKCKSYSHFFSKNISLHAIFNDQNFNDTLTNDIVSFEQLGPGFRKLIHRDFNPAFSEKKVRYISYELSARDKIRTDMSCE